MRDIRSDIIKIRVIQKYYQAEIECKNKKTFYAVHTYALWKEN